MSQLPNYPLARNANLPLLMKVLVQMLANLFAQNVRMNGVKKGLLMAAKLAK